MTRGCFVTGTDTGVGKTTVAAGLCAALSGRGYRVAALKPAESGCARAANGELSASDGGTDLLTFAEWQALGVDKNSALVPGKDGKPTGSKVFVFPNRYEKGRANVGVFNWDGLDKIEVDLSGALAQGARYRVYNCLDVKQTIALATPVLSGVFDGKPVALPMRKDKISPNFDAFLVLPE